MTTRRRTQIQTAPALAELINPNPWIAVHLCNPYGRRNWTFTVMVDQEGARVYLAFLLSYFGTFKQASDQLVRYLRFAVVSPSSRVVSITLEPAHNPEGASHVKITA